jgi:hypothetical protein
VIYRVSFSDQYGEHEGFGYYGSKAKANQEIREHVRQGGKAHLEEGRTTPKTKQEVLDLLNRWGGHSANG